MDPFLALQRFVLIPGGVAAGAAGLGWLLGRVSARARDGVLALGLAAAFWAALWAMGVRPALPLAPSDPGWSWVVWIAPGAAAAGVALGAARLALPAAIALRAAAGAGAAWLVLRALVPHTIPADALVAPLGAAGAASALVWTALDAQSRRGARLSLALPAVATTAATAAVVLQWGSNAVMAQAAGALSAATAATAAFAWWSRGALLPAAAAPVFALAHSGLLLGAWGYLNYGTRVLFPPETALLLAVAPAAVLARRAWLAVPLALALCALAAWLAAAQAPPPSAGPW